ncbi:hypothetical protein FGRMN_10961 [Fusarium graminum]|nr:hypothetical protein FGRMN_10961 [Fusarium graminum]
MPSILCRAADHLGYGAHNTIAGDLREALTEDSGIDQVSASLTQCREDSTPQAIYNWEIGFHAVVLLVERLISLKQFYMALKYARLVLDATEVNMEQPKPAEKVQQWRPTWRFRTFRDDNTRKHGTVDSVLAGLKVSSGAED